MPQESQYEFIMRTERLHFKNKRHELAKLSGVSLDTCNKIFQRQTKEPKASTVQKLYDVLYERHKEYEAQLAREARRAAKAQQSQATAEAS